MNESKPVDLEVIRARAKNAYPGPWEWVMDVRDNESVLPFLIGSDGNKVMDFGDCEMYYPTAGNAPSDYDMDFIANSITDIPALCDEVESLRERLKALEVKEPKWTTEKPTKDGWYWYRYFGEANIAEIKIVDGKPMAGDSGWKQNFAPECDFSTQIPEPTKGDQP